MGSEIPDISTDLWLAIDEALIKHGYYNSMKCVDHDQIHYQYDPRTGFDLPYVILVIGPDYKEKVK